jgi:capsular polysaccharide biosynthesis protein
MSLIDYGRILVRRGWIALLLAVIAAGSAYFFGSQQTPIYRATQRVLVQPIRADLGLTEAANRLLANYAAYLDSELRAAEVIEDLQLDMTPGQLKNQVDIVPIQISLQIQIDVTNPDPAVAGAVARQWGLKLVELRDIENQKALRQDRIEASLQDNPAISLDNPRPAIYAGAGAVLGILIGSMIIFVLEFLESGIIRRREDVEALGLSTLATLPNLEG